MFCVVCKHLCNTYLWVLHYRSNFTNVCVTINFKQFLRSYNMIIETILDLLRFGIYTFYLLCLFVCLLLRSWKFCGYFSIYVNFSSFYPPLLSTIFVLPRWIQLDAPHGHFITFAATWGHKKCRMFSLSFFYQYPRVLKDL